MKKITVDFETRSRVDLKKRGMYVYGADKSTDILCLAVKEKSKEPLLWIPAKFRHILEDRDFLPLINNDELYNIVTSADIVSAHNAGFERIIWRNIMHKRFGFDDIPLTRWQCTAAKASAFALPRDLSTAAQAMYLSEVKDNTGYAIMMKMCKPKRDGSWNEDPDDFLALCLYCLQDDRAEEDLDEALFDLSDMEKKVWNLDQRINDRGFAVDIESIEKLITLVEEKETRLLIEIQRIAKGKIKSTRQRDATLNWLLQNGVKLRDFQKETINKALRNKNLPDNVRKLLTISQSLAKSSVSKLKAIIARANADGAVRGAFIFNGAQTTGRWSAKGVQPHNFPRESFTDGDIQMVTSLDVQSIDDAYGCTLQAASKCLRGMIIARPGCKFIAADFSSVEARILAWLAGESKIVQAFTDGKDLYKVNACDIYGVQYENVSKEQRQIGKVAELALGYQGWVGAFNSMAENYGLYIDEEKAKEIIMRWREARPNIVRFWYGALDTAIHAVETGHAYSYGRIKYAVRGRFLHCRLPSGRLLSYCDPEVKDIKDKWGRDRRVLEFTGVDSYTNKWCRQTSYGGKLVENITQATARDLLAEAMLRADAAGYNIVLHVHDEIVTEMPISNPQYSVTKLETIMSAVPEWAEGCPIDAEGWEDTRFKKI